jgi:hypothetical protein
MKKPVKSPMKLIGNICVILGALGLVTLAICAGGLPEKSTTVASTQTHSLADVKDGVDLFKLTKEINGEFEQNILFIDPADRTLNLATIAMVEGGNVTLMLPWYGEYGGKRPQFPVNDIVALRGLPNEGLYRITSIGISEGPVFDKVTDISLTEVPLTRRMRPNEKSRSFEVKLNTNEVKLLKKMFESTTLVYIGKARPGFG